VITRGTADAAASAERIWRVRKNHTWIDARIRDCQGSPRVELAFFYDGERLFSTECPSREAAIDQAASRLRDLQRAGWSTHW
jgi:hypothetical protein